MKVRWLMSYCSRSNGLVVITLLAALTCDSLFLGPTGAKLAPVGPLRCSGSTQVFAVNLSPSTPTYRHQRSRRQQSL